MLDQQTGAPGAQVARRIVIVIPALNEAEALPLVLADIPRENLACIVVADNGSTDATAQLARAGGAHVVSEVRRGYGEACLAALAAVTEVGRDDHPVERAPMAPLAEEDIVVFLDADHSDYPEDLPSVVAPILAGEADFVVGSRLLGGATMRALPPQAWFGNRLACSLMFLLFGARHTDLGPFRAITVGALKHLEMNDRNFGWTIEMQLKAKLSALRTVEVPVRYRERVGQSKITGTVSGTLCAGYKILGWILGWRIKLWFTGRGIPRYPRSSRTGSR